MTKGETAIHAQRERSILGPWYNIWNPFYRLLTIDLTNSLRLVWTDSPRGIGCRTIMGSHFKVKVFQHFLRVFTRLPPGSFKYVARDSETAAIHEVKVKVKVKVSQHGNGLRDTQRDIEDHHLKESINNSRCSLTASMKRAAMAQWCTLSIVDAFP